MQTQSQGADGDAQRQYGDVSRAAGSGIREIVVPRREHSRKPDEAYELIERMYPDLPRIELFARQARPGWDAMGERGGIADSAR